jgi:glucokinase
MTGERSGVAIGLDIGGTKVAGGIVSADGQLLESTRLPTPSSQDAQATVDVIDKVVETLLAMQPGVRAIGVGCAGLVDWPKGRVRYAANNAYRDLPLRKHLEQATGLPTVVDNDANTAVWAEACFGAAVGAENVVLLTMGTGIGCGLVLAGNVFRGATGLGGEAGHLVIDPHEERCSCGSRGCFEALASGSALARYGRTAARSDPGGRLATLAGDPELVTGELVFQVAREGDPTALGLFEQLGFWLGVGVASMVTLFDPAVVVIGGGLVETGELLLAPARASLQRFVYGAAHRPLPPMIPARLGPRAGMIGAGALALHHLSAEA